MKKAKKENLRPIKTDRDGNVRCRVCGCTEFEPCNPPCSWAEFDLCSNCREIARWIRDWMESANKPRVAALFREIKHQIQQESQVNGAGIQGAWTRGRARLLTAKARKHFGTKRARKAKRTRKP